MGGVCRAHVRFGSNVGAPQMVDEVSGSARPGNWGLSGEDGRRSLVAGRPTADRSPQYGSRRCRSLGWRLLGATEVDSQRAGGSALALASWGRPGALGGLFEIGSGKHVSQSKGVPAGIWAGGWRQSRPAIALPDARGLGSRPHPRCNGQVRRAFRLRRPPVSTQA